MRARPEPKFDQLKHLCGNYSHHWGLCRLLGPDNKRMACTPDNCPIWAFVDGTRGDDDDGE